MSTDHTKILYDQETAVPTEKVKAVGVSGSLAVVLIFAFEMAGVELDASVAAAIVTLVTAAAGYLKRDAV